MRKLLFVCSGNICRSPMAQVIAADRLARARLPGLALSAGTLGIHGQPASAHAVTALAEVGLALEQHRSQGVSALLVRNATDVFVMAPMHAEHVTRLDPTVTPRLRPVWRYTGDAEATEIADPIGFDLPVYRACRDLLVTAIDAWLGSALR
jgi:protein-tyrosine-phosphatase